MSFRRRHGLHVVNPAREDGRHGAHRDETDRTTGIEPTVDRTDPDRLAAHERLSTGGLARWMRWCANNPWKVVLGWVAIIAALIVLVATVGGSLKDEFEIPGSDTQKATDLIESEFASEQGSVLNLVFAAPEGERLDTPERKAAIEGAIAELKTSEFAPSGDTVGIDSVGDPFSEQTFSDDGRIAYAEAQFNDVIETKDRDQVVAVQDAVRDAVAPAGVTAEFNGDAEFPPIEQGTQELLGFLAAIIVLLIVFRTFVATSIPIALALFAVGTAFILLFILAGLTSINTITPILVSMIGIGVGIDYSLFIVTRFRQYLHEGLPPCDAAAEAGASAGRAVIFAGLTVAISVTGLAFFGLDFVTKLGIGGALGVLTTVLIANSLLIAVLAKLGHKIDRLKVPFLKPIDDSEEGRDRTLIARWGRFVTSHAKPVFWILLVVGLLLAASSALVRLGASDQGTQPTNQTARRAYDLLAEGFGPGFNGPIPIVVDVNGDKRRPSACTTESRPSGPKATSPRSASRSSTTRRRWRSCSSRRAPHPRTKRRRTSCIACATTSCRQRRRAVTAAVYVVGPERGVHRHRRPHHVADADLPPLRHRRHVPRARDGIPVDRRLAHRGDHDDPVGIHRLRSPDARDPGGPPDVPHRTRPDRVRSRRSCPRSRSRSSSGSRWTTWSSSRAVSGRSTCTA